jgi:glycosyltransferase involved in cell wall biosynthesis
MKVLHLLNLDTLGGVEQLCVNLILHSRAARPDLDHSLFITNRRIHRVLDERLAGDPKPIPIAYQKYLGPLRLPQNPASLRRQQLKRFLDGIQPDLAILWNRFGDNVSARQLKDAGVRTVYMEQGASWLSNPRHPTSEFFKLMDRVLCASIAAQRVLSLRWKYEDASTVIPNPLRPDLVPAQHPRELPSGKTVVLGVAARLVPLKGIAQAIEAVAELKRQNVTAELHIAGHGPEQKHLRKHALSLGVEKQIRFLGPVSDMTAFYRSIDVFILPSLREPFGMVLLEAAACGCPCIAAHTDGIPEAVMDGKNGILLHPSLPLESSAYYLHHHKNIPEWVYDPANDHLHPPVLLDPKAIADAVREITGDPDIYGAMSAAGIGWAQNNFTFEDYAVRFWDACA